MNPQYSTEQSNCNEKPPRNVSRETFFIRIRPTPMFHVEHEKNSPFKDSQQKKCGAQQCSTWNNFEQRIMKSKSNNYIFGKKQTFTRQIHNSPAFAANESIFQQLATK